MSYAVKYKDIPLMPCSKNRARSLVSCGKAKFVSDKILGKYLLLLQEPSNPIIKQKLVLGVDTGTMFAGFSVVGENCSVNFELEQTRKKKDKSCIKKQTKNKSMYRRLKRSRLRHRETRFKNRTGPKVTYTENYYYQNFRNMIDKICSLYPVTDIIIEDVSHVHTAENKGSGFSPIEQIKTRLYDFCATLADVHISFANPKHIRMYNAAHIRRISNGTVKDFDMKSEDKSEKSFYAHCLDSHSLACLLFGKHLWYTENVMYISRRLPEIDKNRRRLRREQTRRGAIQRRPSKLKKIRTKVCEFQGNHGPWNYEHTEQTPTFSTALSSYGTSIKISKSHCENCKQGDNKYQNQVTGRYIYYDMQFIKPPKVSDNIPYYISCQIPAEAFEKIADYC